MRESQKYTILLGLIILSIVPLFFIVPLPDAFVYHDVTLYLANLFGYIGLVLLIWMYIIGAKSVIGLYIRDMARVLTLHSWLGKYGTLLVFAHPVLVALAYRENILHFTFIPSLASTFDTGVTFGRVALVALLIIWFISAIARSKIAFRPWKYIHYLAYIALPLSLLHILDVGRIYPESLGAQFYFYSLLAIFVLFSLVRIRQLFGFGKVSYAVVSHHEVAPDIMLMRLKPLGAKNLIIQGGQYVYLQPTLLSEEHPFSVVDSNEKTGEILIAYKIFGRFTRKISTITVGSEMYIDGPYGVFTEQVRYNPDRPVVFIAGGIGVTPFVRYITHDIAREQWLFYAAKTRENAAFHAHVQHKLGNHFVPILSAEESPSSDRDERGRICTEILQKYLTEPQRYTYFICGPKTMMKTAANSLLELGVSRSQIYTESFTM
jgi:predicted ferric reductase